MRRLVRRYWFTAFMLALGFFVSFVPNVNVVDPRLLASSPERFAEPPILFGVRLAVLPFGLRYLDVRGIQTISTSNSRTLVRMEASCHGIPLVFHLSVGDKLLRKLKKARRVRGVDGTYLPKERLLVLRELSVGYGFWGTITGFVYGLTRHFGNHPVAVVAASYLVWCIASAIYTIFLMMTGPVGDVVDEAKGALE